MPAASPTANIRLRLRGEPIIELDGRQRALEPRAAALLALVAVDGDVPRERAAKALWPDSANPRGVLRQQLARFRRLAGTDLIDGTDSLRLAPGVLTDIADGAPEDARPRAVASSLSPLLGELRFPDQPAFDAWLMRQRARDAARSPAAAAPHLSSTPALPTTLLRPPRLFGRAAEQAALEQAWSEARAVLLLGEAGLGKSRLLAEVAAARSAIVVAARPGDDGVPYGTLARLLRQVIARCTVAGESLQRPLLARLLPELAPGAALPEEAQRLAVQNAVETLLRSARLDGAPPAALVVDDLHFADDASVEMLQSLIGALHAELRFALAQRPGEGSPACGALRAALEEAGLLTAVELTPLGAEALAALLDSLQLPDLDAARLAGALSRHTGGNPLFALETIKQGLASGALRAGELPRPATVAALIARRLAQLSPRALSLARVAAVAGVDFDIGLAEQVTGERALALADPWRELQSAQVLQEAAFAHDLVADAVLRGVPASVAHDLHAAVASWLQQHKGEPARIAQHWLAASARELALPWLHRAADAARRALRPREAAAFLQQAFDIEVESAPQAQAYQTLERLVSLRLLVDPAGELLALIERMQALAATTPQRIAALLAHADFCMHRGEHLDVGCAAAERAAQLADQAGEALLRLEARATTAVLRAMTGDLARAARDADAFVGEVPSVADTEHRCNLLSKAGFVLARVGRTAAAGALFDEAARQGKDYPQVQVVALANGAQARLQLNDPAGALERLQRSDALRAAHDGLKGSGHANAWMTVWALHLLGRYGDALGLFESLIAEIGAVAPGKLASVYVDRARLWLDLGQPARAHQDRERARAAMLRSDHVGLRLLELRMAVAGVEVAALDEPLSMPHFNAVQAALLESTLLTGEARAERVEHALAEAQRCGYRGLEASALARRARLQAEAGEPQAALTDARAAVALAAGQSTDDLAFPDLALHAAGALQDAGQTAEARAVLGAAVAWLDRAAAPLPLPFQSSLRERNPVHRLLLERARRD